MPKISITVPVYNVEKYIHRCIDSILGQTYTDFELILVDDGSPDSCGAICDEYASADSRIIVIHKENGGLSAARNSALDIATGEYIAFCDSDDFCENTLLETALAAINRERADCVLFGYNTVNDSGVLRSRIFPTGCYEFCNEQDIVDYLIQTQLSGKHGWELWNHIFRRDIIEQFHIRCCTTCNNFAEDMGFVCRYMLHAKRLICIPDCLYNYCLRENSIMRSSKDIIRLNDLNEISYDVGQDYFNTIQQTNIRRQFPILHFLFAHNQLVKMYSTTQYINIPSEIAKLRRIKWWKHNLRRMLFCYNALKQYYGLHAARRTIMFLSYLQHGNWKLYGLQSAIYYRWIYSVQR